MVFQLEEMKRSRVERLVTFNLQTETIPTHGASLTSNRDLKSCLCPVWNQKFCSLNLTKLWLKTEVKSRFLIVHWTLSWEKRVCVQLESSRPTCFAAANLYTISTFSKGFPAENFQYASPGRPDRQNIWKVTQFSEALQRPAIRLGEITSLKGDPSQSVGFFGECYFVWLEVHLI